ncbi:MAG: SIMPL domain-containing protein [Candidatus Taylorbacteria bacterium]
MNIPQNFWKTAVGALVLLTIFLVVVSVKELKSIGYVGKSDQVVNTISVEGTGDAVAIPDVATFSFTVTETSAAVVDAQTKATNKVNAALKAVRSGGVVDKDIQTTSYNINPHYEYQSSPCTANSCPPSRSVLTGYDVSQSTQIKVRDLSKAGTLFAAIGSIGVQNVNGLNFSVDKPESVQAEARGVAIANAQSKAKELAKQLGVSLVRVVSFSESSNSPRPMMYNMDNSAKMMAATASAAPEVSVGEQKVTSSVSVTYEIK